MATFLRARSCRGLGYINRKLYRWEGEKVKLLDTVFLHKIYYVPKIITNIILLKQNKPQILFQPLGLVFHIFLYMPLWKGFSWGNFFPEQFLIFLFFPSDVCITIFCLFLFVTLPPRRLQQKREEDKKGGKQNLKCRAP